MGFTGYQEIIQNLRTEGTDYPPIFAIGGILLEDITLLQEMGIYGVALSGLITKQPQLIQELKNKLEWIL
ncbi:Thiamine-phosphate synthase [compost metagenome]